MSLPVELQCVHCEKPAACIGMYEDLEDPAPACDECCGHGNEDGWCGRISDVNTAINEAVEGLPPAFGASDCYAVLKLADEVWERGECGLTLLKTDPERPPAVQLANAELLRVHARHGTALEFRPTPMGAAALAIWPEEGR